MRVGLFSPAVGGTVWIVDGTGSLLRHWYRQWGDYATWKVCACDFFTVAACLLGPAGNQGWLQVSVTQINEGWRRWGQTSRKSQQKQGVSHIVKPSWRQANTGGPGQEETPRWLLRLTSTCVKSCKENLSESIHLFMLYYAWSIISFRYIKHCFNNNNGHH